MAQDYPLSAIKAVRRNSTYLDTTTPTPQNNQNQTKVEQTISTHLTKVHAHHLNSTDAGQQFHVKVSIATNLYLALTCPIHTYIHSSTYFIKKKKIIV